MRNDQQGQDGCDASIALHSDVDLLVWIANADPFEIFVHFTKEFGVRTWIGWLQGMRLQIVNQCTGIE